MNEHSTPSCWGCTPNRFTLLSFAFQYHNLFLGAIIILFRFVSQPLHEHHIFLVTPTHYTVEIFWTNSSATFYVCSSVSIRIRSLGTLSVSAAFLCMNRAAVDDCGPRRPPLYIPISLQLTRSLVISWERRSWRQAHDDDGIKERRSGQAHGDNHDGP